MHALQTVAENDEKAHRRENRDADLKIHQCVGENLRVLASGDETDHSRRDGEGKEKRRKPPDQIECAGDFSTVPDAFPFSGTEILARIRCHACAERVPRQHKHLGETPSADLCGNVRAAECIDAALQNHASDVVNGIHKRHGKSVEKDIQSEGEAGTKTVKRKAQKRITAVKVEKAEQCTDSLREYGGNSGSLNAHVKRTEKPDVKNDIEDTGKGEKQKWYDAVSNCTKETCFHVVEHCKRKAEKNHGDIGECSGKGGVRRL